MDTKSGSGNGETTGDYFVTDRYIEKINNQDLTPEDQAVIDTASAKALEKYDDAPELLYDPGSHEELAELAGYLDWQNQKIEQEKGRNGKNEKIYRDHSEAMETMTVEKDKFPLATEFSGVVEDFLAGSEEYPDQYVFGDALVDIVKRATELARGDIRKDLHSKIDTDLGPVKWDQLVMASAAEAASENYDPVKRVQEDYQVPGFEILNTIYYDIVNFKKAIEENAKQLEESTVEDTEEESIIAEPMETDIFVRGKNDELNADWPPKAPRKEQEGRQLWPACVEQTIKACGLKIKRDIPTSAVGDIKKEILYHNFIVEGKRPDGTDFSCLVSASNIPEKATYFIDLTTRPNKTDDVEADVRKMFEPEEVPEGGTADKNSKLARLKKDAGVYVSSRKYVLKPTENGVTPENRRIFGLVSGLQNITGVDPTGFFNYLGLSEAEYAETVAKNPQWSKEDSIDKEDTAPVEMSQDDRQLRNKELTNIDEAVGEAFTEAERQQLDDRMSEIQKLENPIDATKNCTAILNWASDRKQSLDPKWGALAIKSALMAGNISVVMPPKGEKGLGEVSDGQIYDELKKLGLKDGTRLPKGSFFVAGLKVFENQKSA